MIRILFIVNQKEGIGGIRLQTNILNKYINQTAGYYSEVFTTKGSIIKRLWYLIKLLFYGRKFDVFHIHGCSYYGFLPIVFGVLSGKFLEKKILVTYHGGDAYNYLYKYPHFTRFFLSKANRIIVLSGYLQSVFEKFGYNVVIIPNIIEINNSQYSIRNAIKPCFITIRSLEPLYSIEIAIKAFSKIVEEYKDASLTILGEGSQRNYLEKQVSDNGIPHISFLGNVNNSEIFSYLSRADILLNTPKTDNMPVSVLEAFASGLLVISSNVGGVPYMIRDQVNGILFENSNVEDLIGKIRFALNNQEKSLEMISNAKDELQKYSWQVIREDILKLYSE